MRLDHFHDGFRRQSHLDFYFGRTAADRLVESISEQLISKKCVGMLLGLKLTREGFCV